MQLIVIQLWLMDGNWVVLLVWLVNAKHANTSINLLVSNHTVMVPSSTVHMLGIIVVYGMMIFFWNKLLVPARGGLWNVISWKSKKRMQLGRIWQRYLPKSIGKNMPIQWLIFSIKVDYRRTPWREYYDTSFFVSSLTIILLWKYFVNLLREILTQPCWQIGTILRDTNLCPAVSSIINTLENNKAFLWRIVQQQTLFHMEKMSKILFSLV